MFPALADCRNSYAAIGQRRTGVLGWEDYLMRVPGEEKIPGRCGTDGCWETGYVGCKLHLEQYSQVFGLLRVFNVTHRDVNISKL